MREALAPIREGSHLPWLEADEPRPKLRVLVADDSPFTRDALADLVLSDGSLRALPSSAPQDDLLVQLGEESSGVSVDPRNRYLRSAEGACTGGVGKGALTICGALEQEIVELRKALAEEGLDAGAHTIAVHLHRRHGQAPAVSTIWRVLSRRGFVTPQPQKRPRSSFCRFEAAMPNERWQADITHWSLEDGTDLEILNALDDHSRFLVASDAREVFKAADVVACFHEAAAAHGLPASLLTDNGAVFTAAPRGGGRCAIELEADRLGILLHHSSPYHPHGLREVPPGAQQIEPGRVHDLT